MPGERGDLWGAGDAYETCMGRWSRRVAPLFTQWVSVPRRADWSDIGCGTGVLTAVVLASCDPARIVGIDSSPAFLHSASLRVADPRAVFKEGNAQSLPEPDDRFDVAVSGLVLNFVPDHEAMVREMARVVRPGGTVALYVWDYAGHMQIMRRFFDAGIALDPGAAEFDDGVKAPVCRPAPLAQLLRRCGLRKVEVTSIDIAAAFDSFEAHWTPFLGGTGSAPKYCMSLDEPARERLKDAVRRRVPMGP